MTPKRTLQAFSVFVLSLTTTGIHFTFVSPLLRIAEDANVSHTPTRIIVYLINIYTFSVLISLLSAGLYNIIRFKLLGVFVTFYASLFMLAIGIGMKSGLPIFTFLMICFALSSRFIRNLRPFILAVQDRYSSILRLNIESQNYNKRNGA